MARETTISPPAAGVSVMDTESGVIDVTRLREGIAPSTLTRLVAALEELGYVQRCPDPKDARASTLAITQLGHETLERLRAEGTALLTQSLMLLTPEQRAALAAALPALEQLADPDPRGPARPLEQQGG